MRFRFLCLASFLASLLLVGAVPAQAGPKVLAPRDRGIAVGLDVPLEVKGTPLPPKVKLDGKRIRPAWLKTPYKHRWIARLSLSKSGPHRLVIRARRRGLLGLLGIRKKMRVTFRTVPDAMDVGLRVVERVLDRDPPGAQKWSWGPAIQLYGLHRFAGALPTGDRRRTQILTGIADFHTRHAKKGLPGIDHPDVAAPALSGLALLRDQNDRSGMTGIRAVEAYLRNEPRNHLGALSHLGARSRLRTLARASAILRFLPPFKTPFTRRWASSIWVDSLVMYALFATQYGRHTGDAGLLDFGLKQPIIFAKALQNSKTGLFRHGYDLKRNQPMGPIWLRGNGWVGMSLVEMLDEAPAGHPRRNDLKTILKDWARGAMATQLPDGLWPTLMEEPGRTYKEASGSALCAFALAKGARLGVLPKTARKRARKTFQALTARLKHRRRGYSVTGTSIATSVFPTWLYRIIPRRSDVSYGTGAFLLLAEELKNETW